MAETSKRSTSKRTTAGRSTAKSTAKKAPASRSRDSAAGEGPHANAASCEGEVCCVSFCPIGRAMNVAAGAGPEVLGHLMNAAREVLLAARSLIEAKPDGEGRPSGLEKIEIG